MLRRIDPSLDVDIVLAADGEPKLPAGVGLESYDGVTMTGSALNIYNGGVPVTRQVELAKAVFAAGVPFFGSCWGLQVAVTAAGGEVRANPRGREFGFARRILLERRRPRTSACSPASRSCSRPPPCIAMRSPRFRPAAKILADNDFGVQAASFTHGRGSFWGVQYHPEYDFVDIAAVAERYGATLVTEGMFRGRSRRSPRSPPNCARCRPNPSDTTLLWKHGLGPAMRTKRCACSKSATGSTSTYCRARDAAAPRT